MLDPRQVLDEAQGLNRRHTAENYRNARTPVRPICVATAGFVLGAVLLTGFLTILQQL